MAEHDHTEGHEHAAGQDHAEWHDTAGRPESPDGGRVPGEAGTPATIARNPFRRGRDYLAVALIVVLAATAGTVVWLYSDIRGTSSNVAAAAPPTPQPPEAVPGAFAEVWRAPSPATPRPVVAGPSVVTGQEGTVSGRDPITGSVRWSYRRDLPLCTVAGAWSEALAVYRKSVLREDMRCGEITALNGVTGARQSQRNGDTETGTRLLFDGSYVTATGKRLLNTWRSDLVLSMEYGTVPAPVHPDRQPRTGCTFGSVAVGAARIGVIERCPGDPSDRLTVYKASGDDSDKPEVVFSVVLGGQRTELVAITEHRAAVAVPNERALVVFDSAGKRTGSHPIDPEDPGIAQPPRDGVQPTRHGESGVTWYTGERTMSLSAAELNPQWTLPDTLGAGTPYGERLLVPVPAGIAVIEPGSGERIRTIPVDRGSYTGPVQLDSIGDVLLEQRGSTLVALR